MGVIIRSRTDLSQSGYFYLVYIPLLQVFDVVLNREHIVVEGLDIFGKVGRGIAHDEIIPFSVKSGKLRVGGESSFLDGKLPIDFVKVPNSFHTWFLDGFLLYFEQTFILGSCCKSMRKQYPVLTPIIIYDTYRDTLPHHETNCNSVLAIGEH